MNFLKICIAAVVLGISVSACRNAECPPVTDSASTMSSTTTPTPTTADGTTTPAIAATDTMAAANNTPADHNAGTPGGGAGRLHSHSGSGRNVMARANGKDSTMSNAKKREGNFTNGTGSDNPGK